MTNESATPKSTGFRATGPADLRTDAGAARPRPASQTATDDGFAPNGGFFDPKEQLRAMLKQSIADRPFSELAEVSYDHQGAGWIGHTLLDTLDEQGYDLDAFDAVGALTAAAVPMACAMVHAAASRGQDLDAFVMDFVYPSVKGPSIKGKRVILLDSWLSEKSYVQTSSLVTLRNGNELSLDFGIVRNEGAEILAVAALIGGVDMIHPTVRVTNPVTDESVDLPFIEAFRESELR
ncbi:orotate phosphoribosyltransferase [Bifidobacterium margollesii]|uniref:Orotate phosphoribosyltransferase n=1 Tax=Bifidobacterium margollesii TaxID=2020964 RepID=A0A2N5J878_9BIFI|nr:orotate phosphoribosyltransferase [Bifidobacterium margollesii]PLS30416.1 orotate phosphoribosyltransferase [Bifidobacterium margollesii]